MLRPTALIAIMCTACSFESDVVGGPGDATPPAGGSSSSEGDDAAESTGEFEGGVTSVGADEACVDTCVPAVPAGWRGPFYVIEAEDPSACPDGYDEQDQVFGGPTAEPLSCECECDVQPGSCRFAYRLTTEALGVCLPSTANGTLNDGGCENWDALGFDVHAEVSPRGEPGECEAVVVSESRRNVAWSSTSRLCAAPARGGDCSGDRCTAPPPADDVRLCVATDDDMACPNGYPAREIRHRDAKDERACACSCGDTECEGTFFAYDNASCDGVGEAVEVNGCIDINVSGDYSVGAELSKPACTTSSMTTGTIAPTSPVTLCCQT